MKTATKAIALLVVFLMALSVCVALTGARASQARAAGVSALKYHVDYEDPTPERSRDGQTIPFLKVSGNVGICSRGVGLIGKPNDPEHPENLPSINMTDRIPRGATVKRAFLYWAGDFGTFATEIGARGDAPKGSDEMILDGVTLSGESGRHPVKYLGYKFMDGVNHRRAFRAEVTDIVNDAKKGEPGREYQVRRTQDEWTFPNPMRVWWGASLVVVYTHSSITSAKVSIADGCNIMDAAGQTGAKITHKETGLGVDGVLLPSVEKGIIVSDGGADDVVSCKFTADPVPPIGSREWADVCTDNDNQDESWDDKLLEVDKYVTRTTSGYTVELNNVDPEGAYADFYVDWYWFAARIDFDITKTAKLVVDADKNGKVSPGDTLEYTVKYRSAGQTGANDVDLIDKFDRSMVAYVSDISGGGMPDDGTIVWKLGKLPSDSPAYQQSYRVTLKGPSEFPSTGELSLSNTATLLDNQTGYLESDTNTVNVSNPASALTQKQWGSKVWYLAEGSTGKDAKGSFETWVLLQNPGSKQAKAAITYMTPDGEKEGPKPTLLPGTRQTFNVGETVPDNWSVSAKVTSDEPIVAERSMYWNSAGAGATNRQAAHGSIGVTGATNTWYLPEGSTGKDANGNFETWVLLQNPGTKPAKAKITYMTPDGEKEGPEPTLEPGTRQTFNVADVVADTWSVSTKVNSNEPVIAERAMYWHSASGVYRQAAHDSIGVTQSAVTWYLAEGTTGSDANGNFETWVLLQNPGTEPAKAKITYMTPDGEKDGPEPTLQPGTRETFSVGQTVPGNWNVSTRVTSDEPIIAERAVYWNSAAGVYRQAAHDSIGVSAAGKTWFLAEGSTGKDSTGSFETWVLLQNPGTKAVKAQIMYMTPTGLKLGPKTTLEPGTRQSFNVAESVPDTWDVSIMVTSDQPVIVERAMYWNTPDVLRQAATDSIGLDP